MNKKSYETPCLETHQFVVVTGVSLPIGTNSADPMGDFLENTLNEEQP